jgi:putative tricarboxylic transport membrane protein
MGILGRFQYGPKYAAQCLLRSQQATPYLRRNLDDTMKIHDSIWGGLCVVLGLAVLTHVQSFPAMPGQKYGPAVFPGLIAVGFIICGLVLVVRGIRFGGRWIEAASWVRSTPHILRFFALWAAMLFYIVASGTLGFLLTAFLVLVALFIVFRVAPGRAVVIAVVAVLAIHLLFYKIMRVPLPWGMLTPVAW